MVAAVAAVAAITAGYVAIGAVNPTTIALTYLVVILLIATQWGIAEATTASILATVCFNVFFLPPVGNLTIADPQNWVSFIAFMATAVIASQLSGRARQRTLLAVARQRDLERLYALSRTILLAQGGDVVPSSIARGIAETFDLAGVALYDRHTDRISHAGASDLPGFDDRLRDVARQSVSLRDPSGVVVTAIRLGGAPIGSLAVLGEALSDTVLQSVANLAAIGLEHARWGEAMARADATRQSGELRATVLDAVAHELKTPLTSMKAAASDLKSRVTDSHTHELASILDEELDRLQAVVSDALMTVRIDTGDFTVRRERLLLADITRTAIEDVRRRLDGHAVVQDVPADLIVEADRDLLRLALRELLDNAAKYSPATSSIEVRGRTNGVVDIVVRNSGPAIPVQEQPHIFERFYRGSQARSVTGTGMGLPIVQRIAQAHGGGLAVTSTADTGTEFTLSLPLGAQA
jgi:two-component system, OmpR family, sensor histidine kinase KdpD